MRLKRKTLLGRSRLGLKQAKFLDLSTLDLVKLDKLENCGKLQWLIVQDNRLIGDDGIEHLTNLWYLDLSNNDISYLTHVDKFLALGTLILTNNNLKWEELNYLKSTQILCISLHGNPCLDSDPYYRIHVIDCLPLIWELDGRLVTVTERLHVKQFFTNTQYTQQPVRHKLCASFKTTQIKNLRMQGIISPMCESMCMEFPVSETHTKHTDERRLKYLTEMVEEDIKTWSKELHHKDPAKPNIMQKFLVKLLENRFRDVEGCNMVLLFLVISLEFQLPSDLVKIILDIAKLSHIGPVETMPIFLLPRAFRIRVIQVLINAAKIDRDNNVVFSAKKQEGGLYPQLFMCLYYTVAQLTRLSQTSQSNMENITPISHDSDYVALMASEVISLLVQVPKFYFYINANKGVINLTASATGGMEAIALVQERCAHIDAGRTLNLECQKIILDAISHRLDRINIKMSDIPVGDRYLALSDSLPIKPLHSVIWASKFLASGQTVPSTDPPIINPAREASKPRTYQPMRGDNVLLGPQVVGEISNLLQGDIGLVKIDNVPVSSGAMESKLKNVDAHFTYVDIKALSYSKDIGMWRPTKTSGDKFTIQSIEDPGDNKKGDIVKDSNPPPLIYTPRTKTPMVYDKNFKRPKSSVPSKSDKNDNASRPRKTKSAGFKQGIHNNSFTNMGGDLEELFPQVDEEENQNEKENSTEQREDNQVIDTTTLHLHDNVHHIRGLTPREESERSNQSVTTIVTPCVSNQLAGSRLEAVVSRTSLSQFNP